MNQIEECIPERVVVPQSSGVKVYVELPIEIAMGGETLDLDITLWLNRSGIRIGGIDRCSRNQKEMAALIFFINNTDKIIAKIGRQLSRG